MYFTKEPDKTFDRDLTSVKVIPSRVPGWSSTLTSARTVGVRIDRERRQAVTVLLKAVGSSDERIREWFGWSELMIRPSRRITSAARTRPCLTSSASSSGRAADPRERQNLLNNLFFNSKRYDVAKVGRYKFNKKLEIDVPITDWRPHRGRRRDDRRIPLRLHAGEEGYEPDDIDHFGNRRLRTVGELIENQVRVGLSTWSASFASA